MILPRHLYSQTHIFVYNPSLFANCTKYNEQVGGNRNKRGGRELSSAHPYGGGARPGMGTHIYVCIVFSAELRC
jgi:hypothetical protein